MAGPSIRFLGALRATELRDEYAKARALLFCGVEDFGMVMVESLAAGCPVVALGHGGALEIVSHEAGVLFLEQTEVALGDAIARFEGRQFDPAQVKRQSHLFSRERFVRSLGQLIYS